MEKTLSVLHQHNPPAAAEAKVASPWMDGNPFLPTIGTARTAWYAQSK